MIINFDKYLETYEANGEDDDENTDRLWNMNLNCIYYDTKDMKQLANNEFSHKLTVIHLNIHSLASKYDKLQFILSDLKNNGITIHVIMLCETFLTDANHEMYPC